MTVIRLIDLETTAMKPDEGCIIEVGYTDLHVETGTIYSPVSWLCYADVIPPENRAVHHISLADVAHTFSFDQEAFVDDAISDGVDFFAAHNSQFESDWLPGTDMTWLCTYKAALRVWSEAPSHSNSALRYWLEDQGKVPVLGEAGMPPHRAGPDAYVSAHILRALFDEGTELHDMLVWTGEPRLLPRCPLGKFRGKPWAEVETGFLQWIGRTPDIEPDIAWNAARELERRK